MFRAFATTLAGVSRGADIEAGGSDLDSATLIETEINRVVFGTGGLRLPQADGGVGCMVVNKTEADVLVYPSTMTGRINAAPVGEATPVAALTAAFFFCYDDGLWAVFFQGIAVPPPAQAA